MNDNNDQQDFSAKNNISEVAPVIPDDNTTFSAEHSHHVDAGPAVLKKYFELAEQLQRTEYANAILRSEIEFTIHFIERVWNADNVQAMHVLLSRLNRSLNMGKSNQAL
jgi:hypothetical protein